MSPNTKALIEKVQATEGTVVIFRNTLPNSRFALSNGKECIFLAGKYATSDAKEIEELMTEVETNNPHISINKDEVLVERAMLDPMEALRRSIIAEHEAAQAAMQAAGADYGNSEQGKLNVASSTDVAAASSGSSSGAVSTGAKIVAGPRG
jgi:hypothetical protein